jgi:hypothetical protein
MGATLFFGRSSFWTDVANQQPTRRRAIHEDWRSRPRPDRNEIASPEKSELVRRVRDARYELLAHRCGRMKVRRLFL